MDRLIYLPKNIGDLLRFEPPKQVTSTLHRYPPSDRTDTLARGDNYLGYRVEDPKGKLKGYSDHYLMVLLWLTYGVAGTIPEWVYRDYLWHTFKHSQKEVTIDTGIVDVMTPDKVIEVKKAANWKHALGQVLAYSYTTSKTPVVALIGSVPTQARAVYLNLGVELIELP